MTQAQNSSATTVITYDDAGRLKQVTQGTALTTNTYDQNGFLGKLTTRVDPAGTMTYAYDAHGRLQTLGSPFSGVASATYGHDAAGREVARTDPAGVSTTRHYDTAARADSENVTQGPSIASLAYTFHPVGPFSRIVQ